MPRSRRIALIGHPHVVIARGNAGGEVFFEDSDYESYLALLREHVREELFTLYAYCLMRTELRLVMRPTRLPLAQVMQKLHGAHAQRVNLREERTGHLFEGRFRSIVIAEDDLASVVRAVHLWPVRRGLLRRAEGYPWSSHRAYVGSGDEWGDLVHAWPILEAFGPTLPAAQRGFARFVEEAALERDDLGVREVFPGIAGDRKFAEEVLAEAGVVWRSRRRPALKTLARRASLLMNVDIEDMQSRSRKADLVLARRLFSTAAVRSAGRSVTEVADYLSRDKAQVSRLVQQGMELMKTDDAFRSMMDAMRGRGPRHTPTAE